jgi:hypothetical protein
MAIRVFSSLGLAVAVLLGVGTATAHAQAAQNTLVAGFGAVNFDLSGTGVAPGMTIRATRALTDHLALEGSFPISWLTEDFGRSRLFAPEAQLQYHWQAGPFRPYVGGGAGVAWRHRGVFGNSDADLTLSVAGGTRFDLTPRVALLGEMRVRGFETRFVGSTAEWLGGVSWNF